jgi:hypothetical protein
MLFVLSCRQRSRRGLCFLTRSIADHCHAHRPTSSVSRVQLLLWAFMGTLSETHHKPSIHQSHDFDAYDYPLSNTQPDCDTHHFNPLETPHSCAIGSTHSSAHNAAFSGANCRTYLFGDIHTHDRPISRPDNCAVHRAECSTQCHSFASSNHCWTHRTANGSPFTCP